MTVPTAHRRFTDWAKAGLWRRVHRAVVGGVGRIVLSPGRLRLNQLAQALEQGPTAQGFGEDQRWTLARGLGSDNPDV